MACNFGAAMLLPLAVATILGFTTPLFAVLLTALVLGGTVGPWRWLSVILGFVGVLIIAQPHAMPVSPIGAVAGLTAGLMVAIISHQIRDLGRTEQTIATVFYFSMFGALFMLPVLPFVFSAHNLMQWALLISVGVAGIVAQLLLTGALRYGSVASVIVMDYSSLIWTTLFGWGFFRQLPPASTWTGAPLIIAAGIIIAWREHRLSGRRIDEIREGHEAAPDLV